MGFSIDDECPYCGRCDTLWHRLWICPHASSVREEVFGRLVGQAVEAREDRPLFTHGWIARLDVSKPAAVWHIKFFGEHGVPCEQFFFPPGAKLFSDGSCVLPHHPSTLARAGCAVIEISPEGTLVRGLLAGLPDTLDQTAVSAEHAAAVLATVFSENGLLNDIIRVDCKALLGPPARKFGPKCPQGHFWRAMSRATGAERAVEFVHVKAHRDLDQAQDELDNWCILGNKGADHYAKVAANENAFSDAESDLIKRATSCYTKLVRGIGKVLADWPPLQEQVGDLCREAVEKKPKPPPPPPHDFIWWGRGG